MDCLIDGLKEAAAAGLDENSKTSDNQEFKTIYGSYNPSCRRKWKFNGSDCLLKSYQRIPRFHRREYTASSAISSKFNEDVMEEFYKYQESKLLDEDELKELSSILWNALRLSESLDSSCSLNDSTQFSLEYDEFKTILDNSSEKVKEYFKPSVVASLMGKRTRKRVAVEDIFSYITKKSWMLRSKMGLVRYDSSGHGFLTEMDLQNYIAGLIPTLPDVESLGKGFLTFYVTGAVSKFVFFLDPLRTGKININDILMSSFLDEIVELRDENASEELHELNWFSAKSALRVYGQFLNLDVDNNGTLSKEEFASFGNGTWTRVFIDRVFQECLTFEGEIDYRTYLDLVLALENRSEPQSLRYIFRILDINKKGYLDAFSLNYMFRGMQELIIEADQEPSSFDDIYNQIVDIIKPKDPSKITLEDLIECGQGESVVNILIDMNGFYQH